MVRMLGTIKEIQAVLEAQCVLHTKGLLREEKGSNQVELFSADFTSKSAAKKKLPG